MDNSNKQNCESEVSDDEDMLPATWMVPLIAQILLAKLEQRGTNLRVSEAAIIRRFVAPSTGVVCVAIYDAIDVSIGRIIASESSDNNEELDLYEVAENLLEEALFRGRQEGTWWS